MQSSGTTVTGMNNPPPPYSMGAAPPIGFQQPPYPLNTGPPLQINTYTSPPNAFPPQGVYTATPLVQQGPNIAALNATPRYHQPFLRYGHGNRKVVYVGFAIYGVIAVIFLIIFLILFFTVFNKASTEFDEAKQRQDAYRKKYFPE